MNAKTPRERAVAVVALGVILTVGGAFVGSQFGRGGGRVASTVAGAAIGGLIGNRIGAALDEEDFENGLGFDGSSIRGFQEIHESDMLLIPDATTAFIDPYYTRTTLSLICSIAIRPLISRSTGSRPRRYSSM